MTPQQKLATFLGDNKMRGEKLFRHVQVDTEPSRKVADAISADVAESFEEIFGVKAPWEEVV